MRPFQAYLGGQNHSRTPPLKGNLAGLVGKRENMSNYNMCTGRMKNLNIPELWPHLHSLATWSLISPEKRRGSTSLVLQLSWNKTDPERNGPQDVP